MTAPQSTYDALLWELHEYGVHRFKHQPTQWRLGELSAPQVQDLTAAIKRLRSKYPTHLFQSFDCSNWEDFKMTGPISKMQPNKHLFNATLTQPDPEFSQRLCQTVPGMAHFAGTGPVGETCGKCRYLIESTRRKRSHRCAKYTELMRCIGDDVPKQTPACRYYSARRP